MGSINSIGFLLDLDGTLIDAADWHKDAFNLSLNAHGYSSLTEDEHREIFNGLSSKRKLEMLYEMDVRVKLIDFKSILELKQYYTTELITKNCKPNRRVKAVLHYMMTIAAKHPSIGVVTNCSRPTTILMLQLSGLMPLVDVLITNEDTLNNKPSPEPYHLGLSKINKRGREVLAIEDTAKGEQSALEAGCNTWLLKSFEELSVENLMHKLISLEGYMWTK